MGIGQTGGVLCALGDLVDDVVVWLGAPIGRGTDTPARVFHRRGGSAANVAAFAAGVGRPARFVGQVGDDLAGRRLVAELEAAGVEACVARQPGGRTGTVVVLVHPGGESDDARRPGRGAIELDAVPAAWLAGVEALHLTAYSLTAEPVGATARAAVATARGQGCRLLSDRRVVGERPHGLRPLSASSTSSPRSRPDVLFANRAEADVLGLGPGGWCRWASAPSSSSTGPSPAIVAAAGRRADRGAAARARRRRGRHDRGR